MSDEQLSHCPECRSRSATLQSENLRWVCAVCGAARIPAVAGASEPAEVRGALRTARQKMATSVFAKLFGVAFVFAALALFGLTAVAWGGKVGFAFLALSLLTSFFSWNAFRRGKRARAEGQAELAKAWELAAAGVVEQLPGSVTPKELAAKLRVGESEAEQMLVTLAGTDRVRISNETDELAFQSTSVAPPVADSSARAGARGES